MRIGFKHFTFYEKTVNCLTHYENMNLILFLFYFRGVADPLNVSDLVGNGSVHKSSIRIVEQETVDNR